MFTSPPGKDLPSQSSLVLLTANTTYGFHSAGRTVGTHLGDTYGEGDGLTDTSADSLISPRAASTRVGESDTVFQWLLSLMCQ